MADEEISFDDILESLTGPDERVIVTLELMVLRWDRYGAACRALLHAYVAGTDQSERTERALFYVTHLLAGHADTASFPDLCRLALNPDRLDSVLGEEASALSYAPMLLTTFDGDLAPLFALLEHPSADEAARADALLVLAYLARVGTVPERVAYDYLAALPPRLLPAGEHVVWAGYAQAVAALGFSGLSGVVEGLMRQGLIDPAFMTSAHFWQDLRDAQQNPRTVDGPVWGGLMPMTDPLAALLELSGEGDDTGYQPAAEQDPVRNPLRHVGRNDPCPCGSGRKYKKCCLQAA